LRAATASDRKVDRADANANRTADMPRRHAMIPGTPGITPTSVSSGRPDLA